MQVLALIPARSGSKGVAHKNIATFHGRPMLAHSIGHALAAASVNRVLVSTDSELYANIAIQHGAEAPFLRPSELADDLSTDLEVFQHALQWLEKNEGYSPDICVHLRPTYPTRDPALIDVAVAMLQEEPQTDSVRTVVAANETPLKMWLKGDDGFLKPAMTLSGMDEPFNQPRQVLPQAYLQTANVDVMWTGTVLKKDSMTGDRIRPLFTNEIHDIDDADQLAVAASNANAKLIDRRFVFDIDGVIATLTPSNGYEQAEPIQPTIDLINALYKSGNTIILATARGSMTGIDWRETTERQLHKWGVMHHELHFGKPAGDYYIDDRFISVAELIELANKNIDSKTGE